MPVRQRLYLLTLLLTSVMSSRAAMADEVKGSFHVLDQAAPVPALVFEDKPGHQVALQDFRGKIVLLNLWATWCGPCVKEMPALDQLQAAHGSPGFEVLALSEDSRGQDAVDVFFKKHQLTHLKIYIDASGRAPSVLHADGMPTTFLIGKDGKVIGYWQGSIDWTAPEITTTIHEKTGAF
ncbi:MAG: TlpA family protein disulfide reductase [Alphaproteobacteria bacterium]|nr:TlpA family protein disulfide reductase [Alphaproteobacteria bacterium]MBV8548949.1 TlpA family protein disulfide reductase [Alphaproteobacteria bacterium]